MSDLPTRKNKLYLKHKVLIFNPTPIMNKNMPGKIRIFYLKYPFKTAKIYAIIILINRRFYSCTKKRNFYGATEQISMFFDEALYKRHSVRCFEQRAVDDSLILQIINAGRLAPSAKNSQPWNFRILTEDEKTDISRLMLNSDEGKNNKGTVKESAAIIRVAPAAIAVTAPNLNMSSESLYLSIGACLENMCLKATDLELGSVIICDIQCSESAIAARLNTERKIIALLIIGYEKGLPKFRNKLPLESLIDGSIKRNDASMADNLPEAFIGDAPFVFISYSHRDAKQVIADLVQLKHCGVRLWYDRSIFYGEPWDEKALEIINKPNCAGVFVYISHNSAKSKNVCLELKHANKKFAKNIVGIHIGGGVISSYLGKNEECDDILRKVFSDKSKYIPRSETAGNMEHIPDIVFQAYDWKAVSDSGVYDDFHYTLCDNEVIITKYQGVSKHVIIPPTIIGRVVTAIGQNAFRGNVDIEEVILPQSIKRIEEGAFFGMPALQHIVMPDSIEYLGVAAFRKCTALKHVVLPKYLKKLEEALFRECSSLTECIVPEGVEEMGEAVFNSCSRLERVVLPDSLKRMTEGGFFGCSNLHTLIIPRDIQGLEKQSFETCPFVNVDAGGYHFRNGKPI